MIVVLLNVYLVILFFLVKLKVVPFNLFWKVSPLIVLLLLMFGLFIPMNWGAPQGNALVVRYSVSIVPDVAGEVLEVPVEPNQALKAGNVLFRIDPTPYEAQVRALTAQLKFQELRLDADGETAGHRQRPRLRRRAAAGRGRPAQGAARSARSGTWTRPSCAHRPTAMSPMSRCARARASPTCRWRR